MNWKWPLLVAVAYLCGSIPFGLLIGLARGVDVRKSGSGNVGTTNVGRVLGRKWGALCLLLDMLKGLLPVLLAGVVLGCLHKSLDTDLPPELAWKWLAVAAAAVLGHVFPVWLKFRGGKGVATGLGVVLGFWPVLTLPALATVVTFLIVLKASKYMSLASMTAAVSLPIYVFILSLVLGPGAATPWPFLIVTGLMALLVVVRHRTNIARLMAGTENTVGRKPKADM